jgi:2,3-bisphosphoglycerate-independent phosphoglycerate mutase
MELAPHPVIPRKKPVLVCILDGWGENPVKDGFNACHVAKTPTMDSLAAKGSAYYRSVLAHGPAVGLPTDQDMGNSEVRCPIPILPGKKFFLRPKK